MKLSRTKLTSAVLVASISSFSATANAAVSSNSANYTDQLIVMPSGKGVSNVELTRGLSQAIGRQLNFVREMSSGAKVFKLSSAESLPALRGLARAAQAVPGVAYVEPDQMMQAIGLSEPTDGNLTVSGNTYTSNQLQWHYYDSVGGMNAQGAWDQMSENDPKVRVAVLDTGVTNHPDLAANVNFSAGYDFISGSFVANDGGGRDSDASDPGDWMLRGECGQGYPSEDIDSSWHGTHVSGTIAAVTDNGAGVAGIGYNHLEVLPVRVLGKCGGYLSDIADAIVWASSPTGGKSDVINMSLGGSGSCSSSYQDAINTAVGNGTTVVVAAGNSNSDASNYQPSSCDNVISVASTGPSGARAYYSNYGDTVDLSAPGGDMRYSLGGVLSTVDSGLQSPEGSTYSFYQGTSMAAPHVAAVAGLLYLKNSSITPAEVEATLKATARDFVASCEGCGAGMLDAGAALSGSVEVTPPSPPPQYPAPVTPSSLAAEQVGADVSLTWSSSSDSDTYEIERSENFKRNLWYDFMPISSVAAGARAYVDTAVPSGKYRYRVRAVAASGETSDWSAEVSVTVSETTSDSGSGSGGKGRKK